LQNLELCACDATNIIVIFSKLEKLRHTNKVKYFESPEISPISPNTYISTQSARICEKYPSAII
jgi:hypothetical protein